MGNVGMSASARYRYMLNICHVPKTCWKNDCAQTSTTHLHTIITPSNPHNTNTLVVAQLLVTRCRLPFCVHSQCHDQVVVHLITSPRVPCSRPNRDAMANECRVKPGTAPASLTTFTYTSDPYNHSTWTIRPSLPDGVNPATSGRTTKPVPMPQSIHNIIHL